MTTAPMTATALVDGLRHQQIEMVASVADDAATALLALQSENTALRARLEEAEKERDSARNDEWLAAVSAVQYMAANWDQDCRTEERRQALAEVAESIVDELKRAGPTEYLDIKWKDAQNAIAAEQEAARLRSELERVKGERDELRQGIAGKDRRMYESVTHGQYLEMAETLHAAVDGGRNRAEAAEARIAGLETALEDERKRNQNLHRRAQRAESVYQITVDYLELWTKVLSGPTNRPRRSLFKYAIREISKRVSAKSAALQPISPEGR